MTGPSTSPLLAREDGVLERLVLLALGDRRELAALRLGRLVDRVLLDDLLPALAGVERLLGLLGLRLGLGQDDQQVAPLRLGEALLVLLVVLLDVRVGDLLGVLGDVLGELGLELVELDAEEDVRLGHPGGLEVVLVGLLGGKACLLVLERLAHFLGLDLDVALLGLLGDPLGLDQGTA